MYLKRKPNQQKLNCTISSSVIGHERRFPVEREIAIMTVGTFTIDRYILGRSTERF
jgi:hypothetical protein